MEIYEISSSSTENNIIILFEGPKESGVLTSDKNNVQLRKTSGIGLSRILLHL
jgi:hypothetical protein